MPDVLAPLLQVTAADTPGVQGLLTLAVAVVSPLSRPRGDDPHHIGSVALLSVGLLIAIFCANLAPVCNPNPVCSFTALHTICTESSCASLKA